MVPLSICACIYQGWSCRKQYHFFTLSSSKIFYNCFKSYSDIIIKMTEREYKEKVKIDDDEAKIERESEDSFGNKVKEKHEVKRD
jgi:hypothetical protein